MLLKHTFKQGANTSEAVIESSKVLVTNLFEYNIQEQEIVGFNNLFISVGGNDQKRVIFSPKLLCDDTGFSTKKISNLLSLQAILRFSRKDGGDEWEKEVFDLTMNDGYSSARHLLKTIPNSKLDTINVDSPLRLGAAGGANPDYNMYRAINDGGVEGGLIRTLTFRRNLIEVDNNIITINMTALKAWKDLALDLAAERHNNHPATHASLKFEGLIALE